MSNGRVKMKISLDRQNLEKLGGQRPDLKLQGLAWSHRSLEKLGSSQKDGGALAALGGLMFESYLGTIDYEGESLEDSIGEMAGTINGKYGEFLGSSSFILEVEGELSSATLITWFEREKLPLLAFSFTRPRFKNRGLARFLIAESMRALAQEGYKEFCLVVTAGNDPAVHLYERMGFAIF